MNGGNGLSPVPSSRPSRTAELSVSVPAELIDGIVERVAALVLERLDVQASESEFLTVAEAAEFLRSKPQRVYDLLSSRRLPKYGDGSRVLVRRADLEAHVRGVAPSLPPSRKSLMDRRVAA